MHAPIVSKYVHHFHKIHRCNEFISLSLSLFFAVGSVAHMAATLLACANRLQLLLNM
jgi:hypothetical protein